MRYKTGIGQDSHRFEKEKSKKKCIVAGLVFEDAPGLDADSDGDVVFHAICNAITSLTHVPILGKVAIDLCHNQGITNSRIYLDEALKTLGKKTIEHVALTIEGKRPKFQKRADDIRQSVATAMNLSLDQVGITFTSGDGLTAFGRGEGLMCYALVTTAEQ
ncbi:MAG: 2-C-methyl-D-erythritol 2,4-cyclodiphosphate synthase [Chlamydiia bacterium]|nr:2-C-methyl-D-erythritol 2,4-cyclodiphosphate synthase [Chlamydiia bacterium]